MKIKFFELAKRVSKKSDHRSYHLGAVIVKKNRVLSIGFNRNRTHPKSPHKFKYLHAEIDAIIGLDFKDLYGSVIYVYREDKLGRLALSKPCESCMEAIKASGIKYLCYTIDNGYKKELIC